MIVASLVDECLLSWTICILHIKSEGENVISDPEDGWGSILHAPPLILGRLSFVIIT